MKPCILLVLCLFLIPFHASSACTAFCIDHEDCIVFGKNLDWPVGEGFLIYNPAGRQKSSMVDPGRKSLPWVSRHASITFNQIGLDFPIGGINEAGLVIEALNYTPSTYPIADSLPSINEFQWLQYLLDCYASVEQVIEAIEKINLEPFFINLHYLLSDRTGNTWVIEFLDHQVKIHRATIYPVLSNNQYENTLSYLKRHKGYGGDMEVHSGPESQERFIRAVMGVDQFAGKCEEIEDYAFAILDNVSQRDTQWRIVYDITNKNIAFQTASGSQIQHISFTDFKVNESTIQIIDLKQTGNRLKIESYNEDKNTKLVQRVVQKHIDLGELSPAHAQELAKKIFKYQERNN